MSNFTNSIKNNKIAEKGILSLADQGIVSATQFLTGVIIGRYCSKEQLGLYMLGLSIILFIKGVQSSIIISGYTIFYPRLNNAEKKYYSGSTLTHQFGLSIGAIILLGFIGRIIISRTGAEEIYSVIRALLITMIFVMLHEYVRNILFAQMKFYSAFTIDLVVLVIQIIGLIILAKNNILTGVRAYWIIGCATGIAAFGWFAINRNLFLYDKKQIKSDLLKNMSLGKWVLAGNIVFFISTQGYYWILAQMKSVGETGSFAACQGVVNIVNPFLLGLYNLLRPMASHAYANGGKKELKKIVKRAIWITSVPAFVFFGLSAIYGNQLIILIYGNKYRNMGIIISILAISLLITAICYPLDYGIWAMGKTNINFWITLAAPIVFISLGLWLVSQYGILGASIGLLLGNVIILILRYVMFKKLVKYSYEIEG